MFNHSVSVPRNYKIAAKIVQKVSEEGGSFKSLLYDDKLKHFRIDVLYALVNETIKHAVDIEQLFENTGILVNEPRLNPWLAKVLTAELIYGKKKLPGKSKPEQTIISYNDRFKKLIPEGEDDEKSKARKPRYVRINTNLLTTSDAIRAFQDDGYKFIRCTSGSYNDYLNQIQNLSEDAFTQDYHVKTIFVFAPRIKLQYHDFYKENKIILQDKATALAVHLLAPPSGSVVLDLCAAPGMKTTQLAAYMRNEGKIYAVERDAKRYETLCEFVEATGSKCVQTLHKDALQIKRGELDDVEYILLDPSCSGSGMDISVHNYLEETRMAKLTSLQEKFLKHAMNAFPKAKRIVYSTCSIFPEENERVVTNIVKASRAKWRVQDVKELLKGQWNNFGSGMYGSMGTRCLYSKSDSDFTTGFFLAVLDRDLKDIEGQEHENNTVNSHDNELKCDNIKHRDKNIDSDQEKLEIKKKHRYNELQNNDLMKPEALSKVTHDTSKSKKKRCTEDIEMSIQEENSNNERETIADISTAVDRGILDSDKNLKNGEDNNDICNIAQDVSNNKKKKKKRKGHINDEETSRVSDNSLENNNLLKNLNEEETPKKKKKKHRDSDNSTKAANVDDILKSELLDVNDKGEMRKKKKKKCKDNQNEFKEDPMLLVEDTEIVSKSISECMSLETSDEKEKLKKNKKKRKYCEDEPKKAESETPDVSVKKGNDNTNDLQNESLNLNEISKKIKKKHKKRDYKSL